MKKSLLFLLALSLLANHSLLYCQDVVMNINGQTITQLFQQAWALEKDNIAFQIESRTGYATQSMNVAPAVILSSGGNNTINFSVPSFKAFTMFIPAYVCNVTPTVSVTMSGSLSLTPFTNKLVLTSVNVVGSASTDACYDF